MVPWFVGLLDPGFQKMVRDLQMMIPMIAGGLEYEGFDFSGPLVSPPAGIGLFETKHLRIRK